MDSEESSPALRVLVAEDRRDAADTLACLARCWGHDVQVCYDGLETVQAAEVFLPDVMLLDLGMPGLDGFNIAEQVRGHEKLRDATLIAVTGYGDAASRHHSATSGFDLHLVKPVEPVLLERMLVAVRRSREHFAQIVAAWEHNRALSEKANRLRAEMRTVVDSRPR